MSRYSPTVLPDSTRGFSALADQLAGIMSDRERKRKTAIADQERTRADTDHAAALAQEGLHYGTAPTAIPDEQWNRNLPGIGLAAGATSGTMEDRLQQQVHGGPGEPQILALPGQFKSELGGVVRKTVFAPPPQPQPQIGLQDPAIRGTPATPQLYRQLVAPDERGQGGMYETESETPQYHAEQQAEAANARKELNLSHMVGLVARAKRGDADAAAALAATDPTYRKEYLAPPKEQHWQTREGDGEFFQVKDDGSGETRTITGHKPPERRTGRGDGEYRAEVRAALSRAEGHAQRWADENLPMLTSGRWSRSDLHDRMDGALQQYYPHISSGDRSRIVTSATDHAIAQQYASNRDQRADQSKVDPIAELVNSMTGKAPPVASHATHPIIGKSEAAAETPAAAQSQVPAWQRRAAELQAQRLGHDEIVSKLRAEGFIK